MVQILLSLVLAQTIDDPMEQANIYSSYVTSKFTSQNMKENNYLIGLVNRDSEQHVSNINMPIATNTTETLQPASNVTILIPTADSKIETIQPPINETAHIVTNTYNIFIVIGNKTEAIQPVNNNSATPNRKKGGHPSSLYENSELNPEKGKDPIILDIGENYIPLIDGR